MYFLSFTVNYINPLRNHKKPSCFYSGVFTMNIFFGEQTFFFQLNPRASLKIMIYKAELEAEEIRKQFIPAVPCTVLYSLCVLCQ